MSVHPWRYPEYTWGPRHKPSIIHVSLGSDRYAEHHDEVPPRHPIGFAPPTTEHEPLLWEGDNA